jgi:chemotaxis protein MotB
MAQTEMTEDDAGESYFASVSDLMVGILFIFLLMLTVFALNFRDAESEQQVERSRYEEALRREEAAETSKREAEETAKREASRAATQRTENDRLRQLLRDAIARLERDIEDRTQARNRLLATLENSLTARGVKVSVDTTSGVLTLSEDVLFDLGDSSIPKKKLPTLLTLAEVLSKILPCYAQGENRVDCDPQASPILETVLVEGHTDRQGFRRIVPSVGQPGEVVIDRPQSLPLSPAESEARNDRLSTDRALNVFKELRQAQSSLINLRNGDQLPLLGVSGYGARRPLPDAQGTSARDYQRNRRIDMRFVLSARTSDEITRLRDQIRRMLEDKQ